MQRFFLFKRIVILGGMKGEAMNEAEGSVGFVLKAAIRQKTLHMPKNPGKCAKSPNICVDSPRLYQ
jgi:hypothetical protein